MSTRRLKALVVDDEKNVRSLLIHWLFREGFVCNEADDGAAALRAIEQAHYDLVVTDLRMPNQHGHSLCRAILDRSDRPRLVVVTGVCDPRLLRDLETRGVDDIFQKPLDPPEFLGRIRELTKPQALADSPSRHRESDRRDPNMSAKDSRWSSGETPVAILLRDTRRAQSLATQLERASLLTFVPDTTDALSHLAESGQLDLLVLENARFGFLYPRDLASQLKSRGSLTEIILLGDETAALETVSDWANMPQMLSLNASDAEVVQAVQSKFAAMDRTCRRVSRQARELVSPFATLSTGQRSLLKLARFLSLSGPELKPDRLAIDVMADAEATAEILRLANGASAGVRSQIANVTEAINRIGVTRSAALLVSLGIKGAEKPLLRGMSPSLRSWYQRRSNLNAAFVAVLAEKFGLSGDVGFVLGMLQDIGIALLGATFGDRYARLTSRARSCGPAHLHVVEHEDLRIEHSEISAALMEQWGFPDELVSTVRSHHNPKSAQREGSESLLVSVIDSMRIAESIADLCDNRHPARRQELQRQLVASCSGGRDYDLATLQASVSRASEIAQQFRAPFPDEAMLRGIFRELLDPTPAAST
jgi:HD-like signal output (HDOD) protein/CheY-like chemotaxis protein